MSIGDKETELYLGIDPGKRGAFAFVNKHDPINNFAVFDFEDNLTKTRDILFTYVEHVRGVVMERVSAFKQGRKSAFTFGTNVGMWRGLLAAYELEKITTFIDPKEWQDKYLDPDLMNVEYIMPAGEKERNNRGSRRNAARKKTSLEAARKHFVDAPLQLAKHSDRADALWLAMYCRHLATSEEESKA